MEGVPDERRQIDEAEDDRNNDQKEAQSAPNLLPADIPLDRVDGLEDFGAALEIRL